MGDKTIDLVSPEGKTGTFPIDQAAGLLAAHFRPETADEHSARVGQESAEANIGGVESFGQGVGRGVSLGATDAAQAALGGGSYLRAAESAHPTLSTLGNLTGAAAGALMGNEGALAASPAAFVGRAGRAVAELGEGAGALRAIGGAAAGGAVEGGLYGAGNAVSQLAMSADPIDAEHMASAFSSNMLLGAGLGGITGGVFKAGERALTRAGAALTDVAGARGALAGVPEDLAGLDDAGLRDAGDAAAVARKGEVAAERQSLEDLRVPQREELATQIKELHTDLTGEGSRPISKALQGTDVEAIEGIKSIRADLADSFYGVRAAAKGTTALAENPTLALKKLQLRADALTALEPKIPELLGVLGTDVRGAGLEHVSDVLAETQNQIRAIKQLDTKFSPIGGTRLTELENSLSPRQQAIEAARDALKNAPEAGILQKSAQAAAFGGVTAVAHAIPGVGVAAPFLGAGASKIVGRLFEHMAGAKAAIAGKTAETASTFLDAARKVVPVAPMVATKILGTVRFAPPQGKEEPKDLPGLFAARSAEIRSQTTMAPDGSVQMRPEARAALSKRLDPIAAVSPRLADGIETVKARGITYISSKIPREPDIGGIQIGPSKWQPSDLDMRSWARVVSAVEDPAGVEERLVHGTLTPEDAEAYRTVYPQRYAQLQQTLMAAAPGLTKSLPYARQLTWSIFAGIPIAASMEPNIRNVLQASFTRRPPDTTASIPGMSPPKIEPSFGSLGSVKKSIEQPTPTQQRGAQHP